jgi:glycosyltransferase involved in cell wall biosynthesis
VISSVGVVVPAHNEQDLLPACLASLRRAARVLRGTPVRLIVVADACTDLSAQAARRAGATVVTVSVRNVGAARAAGIREALRRAPSLDPAEVWLATTDADTVVPPSWLRQQARYASQGWDAVVGTVQVADWSGYHPDVQRHYDGFYDGGDGPHHHVHGANLGVRASAYLAAGGFPSVPTAEDHALVTALAARGPVLRTRALPVITSARRQARAPHGFSHYLAELDAATA